MAAYQGGGLTGDYCTFELVTNDIFSFFCMFSTTTTKIRTNYGTKIVFEVVYLQIRYITRNLLGLLNIFYISYTYFYISMK